MSKVMLTAENAKLYMPKIPVMVCRTDAAETVYSDEQRFMGTHYLIVPESGKGSVQPVSFADYKRDFRACPDDRKGLFHFDVRDRSLAILAAPLNQFDEVDLEMSATVRFTDRSDWGPAEHQAVFGDNVLTVGTSRSPSHWIHGEAQHVVKDATIVKLVGQSADLCFTVGGQVFSPKHDDPVEIRAAELVKNRLRLTIAVRSDGKSGERYLLQLPGEGKQIIINYCPGDGYHLVPL